MVLCTCTRVAKRPRTSPPARTLTEQLLEELDDLKRLADELARQGLQRGGRKKVTAKFRMEKAADFLCKAILEVTDAA
jgi:hypothetical protein